MTIEQLWTRDDEAHLSAFSRAIEADDLATALFAIEGASESEARDATLTLSAWSAEVRARLPKDRDAVADVRALTETLTAAGLRGDTDDYAASRNSHLASVVTTRRGLPILVSAVWMLVGRGAGLVVDGIGLPGHFVARVGGPDGVLVDPFASGARMSREDADKLVKRHAGPAAELSEDMLRATPIRDLLLRVLRNLVSALARERDLVRLYRLTAFWAVVTPDSPEPISQRARLAEQLGARAASRDAYQEIARRFPGTSEARVADQALGRLGRDSVWN